MTARDLGLLVLRLGVGGSLAAHGAQKLFGWFGGGGPDKTAQAMEGMGFEPGRRNALLAGLGEAGGGALLALGLGTGPAAAVVAGTMVPAGSVHAPKFFAQSGGFELPAAYTLVATSLALAGPGKYSLDHLTGYRLTRPWMEAVAFAGTLSAAGFLIWQSTKVQRRREEQSD